MAHVFTSGHRFIQEKLDGRGLPVLLAAQTSAFRLKDNEPEEAKT